MKHFRPTLKFWQRLYLAVLALFLVCLGGGLFAVVQVGMRVAFDARRDTFLTAHHTAAQALAEDITALLGRRPDALAGLVADHAANCRERDGLYLAVWTTGDEPWQAVYAPPQAPDAFAAVLPGQETETGTGSGLEPGRRGWRTAVAGGRHFLLAVTALSTPLEGWNVAACADIEDFYDQWERVTALVFTLVGAVAVLFAAGLYAVLCRMNRPLGALTRSARAMAGGDYSVKIGQTARRDELGELARTLEDLADKVTAQLDELALEAQTKQALVDDLSHEMRTPLTAIGGYAEYIQRADLSPDELAEATETIRFESQRLLNLSDQLVRLSVIRHDPPQPEAVPVRALMRRAARAVVPKAARRHIKMGIARGGEGLAVWAQPDLVESLLVNLCDNGVKACEAGGRVTLAAGAGPGGAVWLRVRDTGRGMSPEALARIGQPFYRADKARSRAEGGAGLGVALCRAIVEAHGATLHYDSEPGQGTTATVTFPPAPGG